MMKKKINSGLTSRMRAARRVSDSLKLPVQSSNLENKSKDRSPRVKHKSKQPKTSVANDGVLLQLDSIHCCPICNRAYKDRKILDRHMSSHKRTAISKLLPSKNSHIKSSNLVNSTKSEVIRFTSDDSSRDVSTSQLPDSTRKFECPRCKCSYSSPDELWSHVRECLTGEGMPMSLTIPCCFCSLRLEDADKLLKHIRRMHCARTCMGCSDGKLIAQAATRSHSSNHQSNSTSVCYLCGFISVSLANLGKHIADRHFESTEILDKASIPDSSGYFNCIFCDFKGRAMKGMKHHYSQLHNIELSSSELHSNINPTFTKPDDHRVHNLSLEAYDPAEDLQENPKFESDSFSCCGCDQRFILMSELWDHTQNSCTWVETPSKCCFCLKAVEDRHDLQKHIEAVHFLKRCDSCDNTLSGLDKLSHLDFHGVKMLNNKFQCYGCQVSFPKKQSLLSHVVNEHLHSTNILDSSMIVSQNEKGDVEWKCMQCNVSFTKRYLFIKHRSKEHQCGQFDEINIREPSKPNPPITIPPAKQGRSHKSKQPKNKKQQPVQSPDLTCKLCGHHMTNGYALLSHVYRRHKDRANLITSSKEIEEMKQLAKQSIKCARYQMRRSRSCL